MPEGREIRRVVGDTVYWLRYDGRTIGTWWVTANGQPVTHPDTYDNALAAFEAVTAS